MGWLGKLFGGSTANLAGLRKAVEQRRFAEARLLAEQLAEQDLTEADRDELASLQATAGDGLAQLNLDEALGFQRAGEQEKALEHLHLAETLVFSEELAQKISDQLADLQRGEPQVLDERAEAGGCNSCGPQTQTPLQHEAMEFPDLDSQLDLVLTSYPPEIADRYRQKGETFIQAFLLANQGDDQTALNFWRQVPEPEQDALFCFEFGSSLARAGQPDAGRRLLEKALELAPGLLLASEALVPVLIELGEAGAARDLLQGLLDKGQDSGFCHSQLALLALRQQETEIAIGHVEKALSTGVTDSGFLQLAAGLFEQTGRFDEAEAALVRLPSGGGCGGGGMSLPLAEFLLRRGRELGKVLDTFNVACRQEPENPRWQLRVAQTYLARQWRKEGLGLLQKVVGDPRLDPELQQEARALLSAQQG